MARTTVDSPRVLAALEAVFPSRKMLTVLSRGNYPKRTFLVRFEEGTGDVPPADPNKQGGAIGYWETVTLP